MQVLIFQKMGHSRLLILYYRLFNTVGSVGKSNLLIATIQGIFLSLIILMIYKVCFLTPYVAETIKTTRSVVFAPLSLILVNA